MAEGVRFELTFHPASKGVFDYSETIPKRQSQPPYHPFHGFKSNFRDFVARSVNFLKTIKLDSRRFCAILLL